MANTFAPNGFAQYSGAGSAPTYEQTMAAISSGNTTPIFLNDPVMQAYNTTGVGTGYIQQATGPVTLTVSATGIATVATGAMTITYTAISSSTANIPTFASTNYAPPVGGFVVVTGATGVPNGVFQIISSTSTTVVVLSTATGAATSATSTPVVTVYTPVAGVFAGCKYLSTAQKRTVWSNYWPGSDTSNDVEAYVITDPNAKFIVQAGSTAVGVANIGENIGVAYGTGTGSNTNTLGTTPGNVSTGLSTAYADSTSVMGTAATYPFRIVGLANYAPDGSNPLQSIPGNDYTAAYNRIIVSFNNTAMKSGVLGT